VVLSVPEYTPPEKDTIFSHSHLYPSGKLGGFALRYDEDRADPKLVVLLGDIRGSDGRVQFVEIGGYIEPYDVAREQADSRLFAHIKKLLEAQDFSFEAYAAACQNIEGDNLNLALFAAAINSTRLPRAIASAVVTDPAYVAYCVNSKRFMVGNDGAVRCGIEHQDMFSLEYTEQDGITEVRITGMLPGAPDADFRDILVRKIIGYDLA
jgi:hypothetical protein